MTDEILRRLAKLAGVASEWTDHAGAGRSVTPETLRRILACMGYPCASPGDLAESLHRAEMGGDGPQNFVVADQDAPVLLPFYPRCPAVARVTLEDGTVRDVRLGPLKGGRRTLPAIAEPGYHRLDLGEHQVTVAVCPPTALSLPSGRQWGLAAQLYGLRSEDDHGIGDLGGVAALAKAAAQQGAAALALSPMHALFAADPHRFSPYSPSSRLFLNPLHAAPALVLGSGFVARAFATHGAADEDGPLIDWPRASAAKFGMLRAIHAAFREGGDERLKADYARFRSEGGALLSEHALFEALHAEQLAEGRGSWRDWPPALRCPRAEGARAYAAQHGDEVDFHTFVQWLADRSVAAAQAIAREAGMRIGLVADLAIGMDGDGSHAWGRQEDVLVGLQVGAPPDLINDQGQGWGLTTFSPRALRRHGYGPFLATLRAVMRHVGGVRIDHVMGLSRLWIVPESASPTEGAYLKYPMADLLRLTALESQRHRAVVIGEDLGTVAPRFRRQLVRTGILGMRVLWFERKGHAFTRPDSWPDAAVAMTSTHDLPTVAGWWRAADIGERRHITEDLDVPRAEEERERDRHLLWRAFRLSDAAHGPRPGADQAVPVVDAAIRHVAGARCRLALFPMEDVIGTEERPNLPGTVDSHPNWRRRLPMPPGPLLERPDVAARLAAIRQRRNP